MIIIPYLESKKIIYRTYLELAAIKAAGKIKPGQQYGLENFRTRHLMPNTAAYNAGSEEVLVLTGATATTFYAEAKSETYPQDDIRYSFTDLFSNDGVTIGIGGDRGCIYYRYDRIADIYAGEDWRAVKYRRWESAPGIGVFNVLTDNGGAYVDRYMFNNSPTRIIHIAPYAELDYSDPENLIRFFKLGNNIFAGGAARVYALQGFQDNYYGTGASDLRFGWGANAHVVGNDANSNIIGDCCSNIIAGSGWQECLMESENSNTWIGDNVQYVTWKEGTQNTRVQSGTQRCTIYLPLKFPYNSDPADNIVVGQEDQVDKDVTLAGSTYPVTIDITNLGTDHAGTGIIDLTDKFWAGIIILTSTNAAETIAGITGRTYGDFTTVEFPIEFRPADGLDVTWTTTLAPLAAETQLATYNVNPVTSGSRAESIVFTRKPGRVGNYQVSAPNPYYQD